PDQPKGLAQTTKPASRTEGPEPSEGVGARAGAAEHDPSPTRRREESQPARRTEGPERSEGVAARAGAAEHDPSPTRRREESQPASRTEGPERSEGVGARAGAAEHDPSPTRRRETSLPDGGETSVAGSGSRSYTLRNVGGVYSCTCPAWLHQSAPAERRTCKHLRKFR